MLFRSGYDARMQFLHETDLYAALRHAVLTDVAGTFNIAGDGTVQMLYPLAADPPIRKEPNYHLKLDVREPLGSDQIVAVTAPRRLAELEQAMRQLDRRRNPIRVSEIITQFGAADVQVGSAGLFTGP